MKKSFKKLLSVILCAVLLFTTASVAFAADNGRKVVDSGFCGAQGENLTWTLYDDGELVISGEGEMQDYYWSRFRAPWYELCSQIKVITVEEGVTSIGCEAFSLDHTVRYYRVNLPKSLKVFGDAINNTIKNQYSFRYLAICYAGSEEDWDKIEFKQYDYSIDFKDETWFEKAYTHSEYGIIFDTFDKKYIMYFNGEEPQTLCDLQIKQDQFNSNAGKEVPIYAKYYSETDFDKVVFYSILGGNTEKIGEVHMSDITSVVMDRIATSVILPEGKKGDIYVKAELIAADGTVLATSDEYMLKNTSVDHRTQEEKIKDSIESALLEAKLLGLFTLFYGVLGPIVSVVFSPYYLYLTIKELIRVARN